MEFCDKLQKLRKQRGLTQEELAEALYVSRAAVSKWESGRGYPGIDSLKAIAKFFCVTVDELLSGEELLAAAQADSKEKENRVRDQVFGLLDLSSALLLFLPLFSYKVEGNIYEGSLLLLTEMAIYLRIAYFTIVGTLIAWGITTLTLQNCRQPVWMQYKYNISLLLSVLGVLLFIISLQPYAATLLFLFLAIKVFIRMKNR